MKKIEFFLLSVILLGAFIVRLYKVDNPIADWHSWRQADTAAVAKNFVKDGFNFLKPQIDNFVATNERGLANPERLFYVEPPFYQTIVFILYKIWGIHEYLARFVSIFFSLVASFRTLPNKQPENSPRYNLRCLQLLHQKEFH